MTRGEEVETAASERARRAQELAEAMSWPPSAERTELDAWLEREIRPLIALLAKATARLRTTLRGALPRCEVIPLNDAGALPEVEPSTELDRFLPGDCLEAKGLDLAGVREIAVTDPRAYWLGPAVDLWLPMIEEGIAEIGAAPGRGEHDQKQELVEYLQCLPNPLLERLEALAGGWDEGLAARRAALHRLGERLRAELHAQIDAPPLFEVAALQADLARLRTRVAAGDEPDWTAGDLATLRNVLAAITPLIDMIEHGAEAATAARRRPAPAPAEPTQESDDAADPEG